MQNSQPAQSKRSLLRRLARIIGKTLLTIFIILLIIFFLIQTPFVQNYARGKAENYLSRKLKTRVRIGALSIAFFNSVTLKGVYVEDRKSDTLLYAGLIDVQVRMLGLLHNDLDIHQVQLDNLTVKIKRQLPDTSFNFQFIVDAFAGPPSPHPDSSKSQPMKMGIQTLLLNKIRFVYKDTVTGNDIAVWIGHSLTRMDGMDLATLKFNIPQFEMDGMQARVWQGPSLSQTSSSLPQTSPSSPQTSSSLPQLILGKINLSNSQVEYRNTVTKLSTSAQVGSLAAHVQHVDLGKTIFQLKDLQIDSTGATFDDDSQKKQKQGLDYAHLKVRQFTFSGDNLAYSADSISGTILKSSLAEQSGFHLVRLQTKFFYSDHRIGLKDLILQTPGSLLQRSASLQYTSLARMMKDPARTLVDLDLAGSRIQVKDILTFAPALGKQPVFSHPNDTWQLNARAGGTLDALKIQTLQFSGIQDLRLDVAGRVLHPFDYRRLNTDLKIGQLSGSRTALLSLLPKGTLPKNITLPNRFSLSGKLTGDMNNLQSNLVLATSSGTIWLRGWARNIRSSSAASYDLDLRTKGLQLGRILQDSLQWGAVTAEFTAKGRGYDIHTADTKVTGRVDAATVRQYTYHAFSLDGSVAGGQAEIQSSIRDSAVRFDLKALADLTRKYPSLQLDWQIDTVDLLALHLVKDTLQFNGHIAAGFADTNPDSLQGTLKLTSLRLFRGGQRLATDSIILVAARNEDIEDIQLHSEMADLDWKGQYKLTETAQALEHTINSYFTTSAGDSTRASLASDSAVAGAHTVATRDSTFSPQNWVLQLHVRPSPLVLAYMPSLKGTDSLGALVSFNSGKNDLQLELRDPHVQLGSQHLDQLTIKAATAGGRLNYKAEIAGGSGSGFELHRTWLAGGLQNNRLTTALVLDDIKNKERFRLAGELDQLPGGLKFVFNPDSLLLNYDPWKVSRDNFVIYDSAGLVVHHFTISNNGDSLSLNSQSSTGAAPLDVRFGNFRLSTISRLANQDSVIADGLLNGTAEVKNLLKNPLFTSNLKIQNLSYKTDTLGDLSVNINNEKDNTFSADIGLQGKNNDIAISGDYRTDSSKMDLKLDLRRINLAAFAGAAKGTMDDMRGSLIGSLTVQGTFDKPTVRGNLYFDSAVITPTISGERLDVSKDRIAFDEDGFNFSEFTLRDSAGNKLILDGNVFTKDYHKFGFDISLNAQNFRMVNAPENSSRQFYGQLNLDAAINLEGKLDAPAIDGTIRVNKRTNFYYVLPGDDPEVGDRVGVVRFVDHRTGDTLVDRKALALRAKKTEIKGLDVSLNLLTDTSALLNVVIDPRSGDELNVRGQSNLVFQLEKSGKMDLTGSYEVNGGFYSLSFEVLKRKFSIDPGSVITWTGDPTKATVNLTASYTTLTPAIDLVSNVISVYPPVEQTKFQQKLPFLVTLKLEGDLLKPTITFDISLPTTILTLWPDVDQRLTQLRNQQSEMNEQVFALLLLGRFVGQDPLASATGGGSTPGNLAFSSASQILTNQMDQVAASLIKQVDIHFNLNNQQDYTTGTEIDYTELDINVSKQFMEDRLRVNVGSTFDVVGTGAPKQAPSNVAGNVDAGYKLSKDGRYLLRAYRQNQYQAVVLGQVIETGVGFVFTFNYDKFKEIWHRAKGETIEPKKTSNSSTTTK
jgi:TamB, inner membrane protein subunit of TAM complex